MLMVEEFACISGTSRVLSIDWLRRTVKLLGVFLMAAAVISFVLQMLSQARQTLGQIIQTHLIAPQPMTNLSESSKSPHNMSKMIPPHKPALVLLVASLAAAIAISIVGVVSLASLLVPHLADLLDGSTHTRVPLVSVMLATGYLLLLDYLFRSAFFIEIPLGIIPAMSGSSVFVAVLVWKKQQWS